MSLWNILLILIALGIVSGHVTHIVVTGTIFEGLRRRIRERAGTGGRWAYFSKGFHCQLCSGVWYSAIISLWWTIGLLLLFPDLWRDFSGRDIGWVSVPAWFSLFLVQMFLIAAIGHLFREIVGLIEDRRTKVEEETEVLAREVKLLEDQDRAA
mgnify:CR=1 FL=1